MTGPFYTQEGATIQQLNGSDAVGGAHSLSLELTLRKSPYPVGYELNGLSDTGDWYQVVIADNWPGCNSGFEEVTEVWDRSLNSGPVNCDSNVTLSTGDVVILGLNFTSPAFHVCLIVSDTTTSVSHSVCQAQPDSGGSEFQVVQGVANSNGYFTGPMTEVVNLTTSSCPSYTAIPTIDYRGPPGTWVTQYVPWSDEFDAGTYSICYSAGGNAVTLSPGDVTTHYVNTSAGSGYAARWGAGQNLSLLNTLYGWRYETDPPTAVQTAVSTDQLQVQPGTRVYLSANVTGGVGPYTAWWYVNGTLESTTTLNFSFTPSTAGQYPVRAIGIDSAQNAVAAATVMILAYGPLTFISLVPSPTSGGADTGQTVTFVVSVSGGLHPLTYNWTGLPSGCVSANVSRLTCAPQGPGLFHVAVSITDSNNTTVASPTMDYLVNPTPLASLAANLTELDLWQSTRLAVNTTGGAGPFVYNWAPMPPGCPSADVSVIVCTPSQTGSFPIMVTATDANGVFALTDTVLVLVHPTPAATVTASTLDTEVGQTVHFRAALSGGTGVYSLVWSGLPTGCTGGNVTTLNCTPSADGTSVVRVTVLDSIGGTGSSAGVSVTVYPALTVALEVSPSQVAVGDVVTLTANVQGGHGTLYYEWNGLPPSCPTPPTRVIGCQVADAGSFTPSVIVSDGLGFSVNASAPLDVAPGAAPASWLGLGATEWAVVGVVIVAAAVLAAVGLARRRRRGPDAGDEESAV